MFHNVQTNDEKLLATFPEAEKYLRFYGTFDTPITAVRQNEEGYGIEKTNEKTVLSFHTIPDFYAGYMYLRAKGEKAENGKRTRFCKEAAVAPCTTGSPMKISALKTMLLQGFLAGFNSMELIIDDLLPVDGEPYFGYLRGRYSKAELKDLAAFADLFEAELFPSVQTLGHLDRVLQHPVYGKVADTRDVLLCGEEKTYELLEKMIAACAECFTTKRIHIGMDEAHSVGLGKYLDLHGYRNRHDIIIEHLARVREICKKYGLLPSMWGDMFFHIEFGTYYAPDKNFSQATIDKCPKDMDIIYWDYYNPFEEHYDKMLRQTEQLTVREHIQYAGSVWTHVGFAPLLEWTDRSMMSAAAACRKHGIQTFLLTYWGDDGMECPYYSALSNLFVVGEALYEEKPDYALASAKLQALTDYTREEWMTLEKPHTMFPEGYPTQADPAKYLFYQDVFLGKYDKYVFGNYTDEYRQMKEKLFELSKRESAYGYLFDYVGKLAAVLELKATLGVELRAAYRAKDTDMLKKLVNRLEQCAQAVETFYRSFLIAWRVEKKDFALETHDVRFGGLKQRLTHAKEIVEEYLRGKTDKIEELEEDILYLDPEHAEKPYGSRSLIVQPYHQTNIKN